MNHGRNLARLLVVYETLERVFSDNCRKEESCELSELESLLDIQRKLLELIDKLEQRSESKRGVDDA